MPLVERGAPDEDLGPIDLEFDEANRTFDSLTTGLRRDLKLYRAVATACMALRRSAMGRSGPAVVGVVPPKSPFTRQAVDKLRSLTVEYANGCEQLNREKVEMLLLALEILLTPGVEPQPDTHFAADATRMMAVLGETTKVGSHSELTKYFARFQQIASRQDAASVDSGVAARRPVVREVVPTAFRKPMPPETLLFYLRLGPGRSLKLTAGRDEPLLSAEPPPIDNSARTALTMIGGR